MRATMSVPPPAPKPTSTRIGLSLGHSAAAGIANPKATQTAAVARANPCFHIFCPRFSSLLVFDRVAQRADLLNLDLDDVAGLHPDRLWLTRMADAGRRAGKQHVAGLQRHSLGQEIG